MSEKKLVDDVDCPECLGSGFKQWDEAVGEDEVCETCNGDGYIERPND